MNSVISKLDLNLFSVFEAIYTERNLTKAGQILGITQPAVSNSLSRLREMYNDELFTRSANGMQPTPVAENSIQSVREALHLLRASVQDSHVFNPTKANKSFVIACSDAFEAFQLPNLLQSVLSEAPQVDITTTPLNRKEMANQLASGLTDLVVDVEQPPMEQINSDVYGYDKFVLVVREDHPLARQESISSEHMVAYPHIHLSSRLEGPVLVDNALSKEGNSRHIGFRTPRIFSACLALQNTDLVATVPKSVSELFKEMIPVKIFNLPVEVAALELRFYWHETMDKDPANVWLREKLLSSKRRLKKPAPL